jgi:hypothetical protein
LRETLARELGHAIGFGHAAARPAVMYSAISSYCLSRTTSLPLEADDLAVVVLYPCASSFDLRRHQHLYHVDRRAWCAERHVLRAGYAPGATTNQIPVWHGPHGQR